MYIQVISPIGNVPGADECIVISTSLPETQAISAKVGEAARPSQVVASRACWVSGVGFPVIVTLAIFDPAVDLHGCLSALNLPGMYDRAAGERE